MKYIKTFEYKMNVGIGPLCKIYSGRYTNILSRHCMMLDRKKIKYDVYVDMDDPESNQDAVIIIINDESKQLFYDEMKSLGFKPLDPSKINFDKLTKFNSIQDYLKTKEINEVHMVHIEEFCGDENVVVHPVDDKGKELENGDYIVVNGEEYNELKDKGFVNYDYDYETALGQHHEIEEFLEFIRTDEYKASKKYNL